jgi:hypothetical protein
MVVVLVTRCYEWFFNFYALHNRVRFERSFYTTTYLPFLRRIQMLIDPGPQLPHPVKKKTSLGLYCYYTSYLSLKEKNSGRIIQHGYSSQSPWGPLCTHDAPHPHV